MCLVIKNQTHFTILIFVLGVGIDGEVAKTLQKILTKQGMKFKLNTKVTSVNKAGGVVKVEVEPSKGGAKETVTNLQFCFITFTLT